jgi:hypothetical protein
MATEEALSMRHHTKTLLALFLDTCDMPDRSHLLLDASIVPSSLQ